MAKKVKKMGLGREDLWKFVPKKTGKGMPSICVAIIFESGFMKATNFSEIMAVPSDTEVNFPIGISLSTLTPLYKSKDWPKSIRGYVELVEGKKQMKAEITTEKGHTFWVKDYELFDAADFLSFGEILFLPKGEITDYDAKAISDCADFCELAHNQDINEAIWDIDIENGKMRGFDVSMGVIYDTALVECRIPLGVAKYCLSGGSLHYGANKEGKCFATVIYPDKSEIMGGVGDRVYPQVESLFEDDLKVWFGVSAQVHEWKRVVSQMLVYWQKGRQVRISTTGNGEAVLVNMFEFASEGKRECIDVESVPTIQMNCKHHYSDGPNSFAFNPKLLKVQLDQFEDQATLTIHCHGVHGFADTMGEPVHRLKPLRLYSNQHAGKRLLMPVVDWAERIHTGLGMS